MKMDTIERLEHMACAEMDKADQSWLQSGQKTEYLRNLVSICEKLAILKETADQDAAYRMGYGGVEPGRAYRGRDSMGRYTSAGQMYGGMYEAGYSGEDQRMEDLRRRLEHMAGSAAPEDRKIIMEAMRAIR